MSNTPLTKAASVTATASKTRTVAKTVVAAVTTVLQTLAGMDTRLPTKSVLNRYTIHDD